MKKLDNKDIRSTRDDDRVGQNAQANVNTYFDATVAYWDGVYSDGALQGVIYQQRQAAVLDFVDAAALSPGASVLEIGCGAGYLTAELARRGLLVEAVDASPAMVESTATLLRERGLDRDVTVEVADVHALPFSDASFDLVVAVGVIPWLHSPGDAVVEMARVLRAHGQLIVTADNRLRLSTFTDPRAMLAQTPLKHLYRRLRRRPEAAMSRLDSPRAVARLLAQAQLRGQDERTVGFGPLSMFGRPLMEGPRGVRLNNRLQTMADRGVRGVRSFGWHYIVRARKT
jgi:ubiquinone/menaquinone biosynthesis C-methylase UbiE